MKPWRSPLFGTIALAVVLLVAVGGWLLTDSATSHSDALKTGGLAGGAVVALYALWLNDRRRKVEESRHRVEQDRHELEQLRTEQDRDRISDERFARAIELLGHDADQVRVGALHALAGLARGRTDYTQTVLDVLCSYLRRPFEHIRYTDQERPPDEDVDPGTERELQVRLTAQRLIRDLLPSAESDAPAYDLDLTGASLEYFDLHTRKVGTLIMRYAKLHSSSSFAGCEITGPAWFTSVSIGKGRLSGKFRCEGTVFHSRAWFSGTEFGDHADFTGTIFAGRTTFKNAVFSGDALFKDAAFTDSLELRHTRFAGKYTNLKLATMPVSVDLYDSTIDPEGETRLPPDWKLEELPNGRTRIAHQP